MEKFRNEYVLRLSPKAISPDLHGGGAVARGLEVFRRDFYGEGKTLDESIRGMFLAFTKFWGDYEPPEKHKKTYVNMFNALLSYVEHYPPEKDHVQPHRTSNGAPAVEYTFAVPLPINHPETNLPLIYGGRFDMIGEMANELWIVDEKTTGGFGPKWSEQWVMRSQFIGYTWACRLYEYPQLQGAIVRGIAILVKEFRHLEAIVQIPQWQVDRWYENMIRTVQRMVDAYTSNIWDMDYGNTCSSYSGCSYNMLCTAPRPEIWYNEFEERIWNPLAKDPTDSKEQEALAVVT